MPKVISWSPTERAPLSRLAEWIVLSARHTAFLPLIYCDYYYHFFEFFFAGDIAIYSNLLLNTFLPFYFWWLFFLMLPLRDSYFNQVTFAKSFLSFWVVAAGLQSWLALLFPWLQAVILTTHSPLINKWVTTLRSHGQIRQILIPSSPNNWESYLTEMSPGSCHPMPKMTNDAIPQRNWHVYICIWKSRNYVYS